MHQQRKPLLRFNRSAPPYDSRERTSFRIGFFLFDKITQNSVDEKFVVIPGDAHSRSRRIGSFTNHKC